MPRFCDLFEGNRNCFITKESFVSRHVLLVIRYLNMCLKPILEEAVYQVFRTHICRGNGGWQPVGLLFPGLYPSCLGSCSFPAHFRISLPWSCPLQLCRARYSPVVLAAVGSDCSYTLTYQCCKSLLAVFNLLYSNWSEYWHHSERWPIAWGLAPWQLCASLFVLCPKPSWWCAWIFCQVLVLTFTFRWA